MKYADSKQVRANIEKQIQLMETKARSNLLRAGYFVQAESQRRVPVDTGFLRASAKTELEGSWSVAVSYNASYAILVHEDLNAYHKNGEAKFLQNAIDANRTQILSILGEGLI